MQVREEPDRSESVVAEAVDASDGAAADVLAVQERGERGMTTAEYAVGTVATVSFAGVLISVLTDPAIWQLIMKLIIFLLKLFWPDAPVG